MTTVKETRVLLQGLTLFWHWVNSYVNKHSRLPLPFVQEAKVCKTPSIFDLGNIKPRVLSMIIVHGFLAELMTRTLAGLFARKVAIKKISLIWYISLNYHAHIQTVVWYPLLSFLQIILFPTNAWSLLGFAAVSAEWNSWLFRNCK